MFKFLICFNIILVFVTPNESKFDQKDHLNDDSVNVEAAQPNLWFPYPPHYPDKVKSEIINVAEEPERKIENLTNKVNSTDYTGLWFPYPPDYPNKIDPEIISSTATKTNDEGLLDKKKTSDWAGLWFPSPPSYDNEIKGNTEKHHECDNGKENVGVDFDPEDKRHSFNYLCFGNRTEYEPNFNTSALMKEYFIPVAYEPPLKCLNEHIEYSDSIPTYGAFRPLPPKYGTYTYLPPQRWLHSLADGAIVLLYHPCAFPGQIEMLENILKSCLYRHIITPSQQLTPQRPLSLIAWGKHLQMSVVDKDIVIKFIKENAKMGFGQKQLKFKIFNQFYDAGLLNEAHLVTDEQDIEICGYQEMR